MGQVRRRLRLFKRWRGIRRRCRLPLTARTAIPTTPAPASIPTPRTTTALAEAATGPKYVQGPVRVVGTDHYRLDSNGDGVACE